MYGCMGKKVSISNLLLDQSLIITPSLNQIKNFSNRGKSEQY